MSSVNVENGRNFGPGFGSSIGPNFAATLTLGAAFGLSACNLATPIDGCSGNACEAVADTSVEDAGIREAATPSANSAANTAASARDADAPAPTSDAGESSDAGIASDASGTSDADASPVDAAPPVPCNGACQLELCDVEQGVCVACAPAPLNSADAGGVPGATTAAFGCSAETPVCKALASDAGPRQCVECVANEDCTDPAAARCDTESNTCTPCGETALASMDAGSGSANSDCAHLLGVPVCHAGTCVECFAEQNQACGGAVCNDLGKVDLTDADSAGGQLTCSGDALQGSAAWCQPCVSDAQCQAGQACFLEADGEGACFELKSAEQPESSRIEFPTSARAVSVSGAAGAGGIGLQYYALPGEMTCSLFLNAGYPFPPQNGDSKPLGEYGLNGWCETDADCGTPGADDAICGDNNQCTVACTTDAECGGEFILLSDRSPNYALSDIDGTCDLENGQCHWNVHFSYAIQSEGYVDTGGRCRCASPSLSCTLDDLRCTLACTTDQECAESEFLPTMSEASASCSAEGSCDWGL